MYVAVKGGEAAIERSLELLAQERRGDPATPELTLRQVAEQLALGVDRVMSEGALYDRELAALSLKQACGDQIEAAFLLRAFRTTLPRFGASLPVDSAAMRVRRRISAKSWAQASTTVTGCWISASPSPAYGRSVRRLRRRCRASCRA
jgi:alpha-D-ribose 1-methylphosphonate 5-triphosphate synthase subunit PhnI